MTKERAFKKCFICNVFCKIGISFNDEKKIYRFVLTGQFLVGYGNVKFIGKLLKHYFKIIGNVKVSIT